MRRLNGTIIGLLLAAAAGCNEPLVVENDNDPDRRRVEARPSEIEVLIASHFRVIHNATMGSNESIFPQMMVMGMESYSSNANFGMNVRGNYPRTGIDNNRGNATANSVYNPYVSLHQAARAGALALSKLGDPNFLFSTGNAQKQRARAFSFFLIGVGLGNVALAYDSGAAVHSSDDVSASAAPVPLVGYDSLMRYALANLDSAIAIAGVATPPTGTSWFPLPSTWINGNALTAAQFVQLANSYKARFRAGVARTPAERAAVNWAQVIAEATAGVTADFSITMSNVTGGWFYRPAQMDLYQSWHQMWSFIVGMADTSGNYDAWLATPIASRLPFNILTNDGRFPGGGNSRAAQNTASGCGASSCLPPSANQFFRNRPTGQDVAVQSIAYSFYDFHRFQAYFNANRNGAIPFFPVAELNLLRAEGQLRLPTPNPNAAIALINISRAQRGLPAIPAGSVTVPGAGCVPRVPTGPSGPTTCGSILEAMKWEKRMETAYLSWGGWYFDGRGWGDLPSNTPLQYPVPFQELDARTQSIYTTSRAAATGTYGL